MLRHVRLLAWAGLATAALGSHDLAAEPQGVGGVAGVTSGQVDGRAIDRVTQSGIGNAEVRIVYRGNRVSASQPVLQDGTFTLRYDGEAPVWVVSAAGYSTFREAIRPGQRNQVASLERDITVSGRLTRLGENSGLRGTVTILSTHPRNIVSKTIRTADGAFSASDILPGPSYLMARSPGMGTLLKAIRVEAGSSVRNLLFEFEPAASVSGQVRDSAGNALSGVLVEVEYALPPQEQQLLAPFVGGRKTTAADGRFILSGISPGIRLRLVPGGRRDAAIVLGALAPGSRTEGVMISASGLARR